MKMSLTRRTFLARGAAAAGFATVATDGSAVQSAAAVAYPPEQRPERNRKAVKFGMVRTSGTVREKFDLLAELGFDGVEIDAPSDLDLTEVVAASQATGIDVHGVVDSAHWQKPLSHPDAAVRDKGRAALEVALRDANVGGASTVLLVPGIVHKGVSYRAAYERSQQEIRKVLPLARDLGVRIALENVWNHFLLSPLECARYIDELDPEVVGAYFDVGNVVNYGWPEHWIEVLGPRILKIDVKEYSRKKRNDEGLWKGFGVELHEGDCDWPSVMRSLGEVEYLGWFTAEIKGGDEQRLARIAEDMDRIFAG